MELRLIGFIRFKFIGIRVSCWSKHVLTTWDQSEAMPCSSFAAAGVPPPQ